jgi:hypothetical protein
MRIWEIFMILEYQRVEQISILLIIKSLIEMKLRYCDSIQRFRNNFRNNDFVSHKIFRFFFFSFLFISFGEYRARWFFILRSNVRVCARDARVRVYSLQLISVKTADITTWLCYVIDDRVYAYSQNEITKRDNMYVCRSFLLLSH